MYRRLRFLLLAWVLLATAPSAWCAVPESEVRAAIIVNFMHYVEWPDSPDPAAEMRICVAGQGSTAEALLGFHGRTVHGQRIAVENRAHAGSPACRLLFIGDMGSRGAIDWLRDVSGQPVLTVSEGDDFLPNGGIISLHRQGSRIAFDVNLVAMRRSNLRIGSQLLRLARDVHGK